LKNVTCTRTNRSDSSNSVSFYQENEHFCYEPVSIHKRSKTVRFEPNQLLSFQTPSASFHKEMRSQKQKELQQQKQYILNLLKELPSALYKNQQVMKEAVQKEAPTYEEMTACD